MKISDLFENDSASFGRSLKNAVAGGVSQMHADFAVQQAKNPDQWKFKKGDQVYSKSTGKVYTITNLYYDSKKQRPMYFYSADNGEERGTFIADLANKSLIKISESATAGATSSGSIATISNPHISPGPARGKKSYIGSPGQSGTKSPPQPKPKKQKPSDNALNMKSTSLFGAPLKR